MIINIILAENNPFFLLAKWEKGHFGGIWLRVVKCITKNIKF